MTKYLLIALNLVALAVLPVVIQDDLKVIHDTPSSIISGEQMMVGVKVELPNITGPTRLTLTSDNPKVKFGKGVGSTIQMEGGQGNFTAKWESDGKSMVHFSYKLSTPIGFTGLINIKGELSYLKGSTRKNLEIPVASILVLPEGSSTVRAYRRIKEVSDGKYMVTIRVEKGDQSGWGGVKEFIPDGYTPTVIADMGATVTADEEENTLNYRWIEIPEDIDVMEVSYSLSAIGQQGFPYPQGTFTAEFLYSNKKFLDMAIKGDKLILGEPPVTGKAPFENDPFSPEVDHSGGDTAEKAIDNGEPAKDPIEPETPSVPTPVVGLAFKVQICASHKVVKPSYFKKRHNNFSDPFITHDHDGWVKYICNKYNNYNDAASLRDSYGKYKLPGPFVVAYNGSERITVQEAFVLLTASTMK